MSRPHIFWHQVGRAHTCVLESALKSPSPSTFKRTHFLSVRSWDSRPRPRFLENANVSSSRRNIGVFAPAYPRNGSSDNPGIMTQRRAFSTAGTDGKDPILDNGLKGSTKTRVDSHSHEHSHSHSHSHSLFSHSHTNGEDHSHSHGTEQIIAVLEGQGTRVALQLLFTIDTSEQATEVAGSPLSV